MINQNTMFISATVIKITGQHGSYKKNTTTNKLKKTTKNCMACMSTSCCKVWKISSESIELWPSLKIGLIFQLATFSWWNITSKASGTANDKHYSNSPLSYSIHVHTHGGDLATAVLVKLVATCLTSEAIEKELVAKITVSQLEESFAYLYR